MSRVPLRNREPVQPLPYFSIGLDPGFLDLGVGRQAEVVVRADHDHPLAFDHDLGVGAGLDGLEVRVEAGGDRFLVPGVVMALLENVGVWLAHIGGNFTLPGGKAIDKTRRQGRPGCGTIRAVTTEPKAGLFGRLQPTSTAPGPSSNATCGSACPSSAGPRFLYRALRMGVLIVEGFVKSDVFMLRRR
jgi:hypothetical protein